MSHLRRLLTFLGIGAVTVTACAETLNFDTTPDRPEDFGYKVNWFAVKTEDSDSVIRALDIEPGIPANWSSGISAAYGRTKGMEKIPWAFVSPPVRGWILVVGHLLPYPVMHTLDRHGGIGQKFEAVLSRLTSQFTDVQFFGSHRVVGFVAWARAQRDQPPRIFSFGDGDIYANIGNQTKEEARLEFTNLSGLSLSAASDLLFSSNGKLPNETDVVKLAAKWSIDPSDLSETETTRSLGMLVQLPAAMAQ